MPKIRVPMLAIQGENDEYSTTSQIDSITRLAKKEIDVLMLPDCGHTPHQEKEALVFQAMKDFILRIKDH